MGRVLSRDDSSYKLAGMKKGIFEEQQEIWGGIVGGHGRREVNTIDNKEPLEVWQKNEVIVSGSSKNPLGNSVEMIEKERLYMEGQLECGGNKD